MKKLWDMVDFTFMKNDHTAAELLLWPHGFQQYTTTPGQRDLRGARRRRHRLRDRRQGLEPGRRGVGDHRQPVRPGPVVRAVHHQRRRARRRVPHARASSASPPRARRRATPNVSGFEFEDDEAEIELEFQRHLLFSLDLAESAADPANPVSHMGNTAPNFYVDRFSQSWGDPQPVQVTVKRVARRRHADATGSTTARSKTVPTTEWPRRRALRQGHGRLLPPRPRHRHRHQAGRRVRVWFTGEDGTTNSASFNYRAVEESGDPVLIMADENYTGPTPDQDPSGPNYLSYYTARSTRRTSATTSTTSTRTTRRRPTGSACSATTRRSSGTRATTTSPGGRASPAAPAPRASTSTRRSTPVTT